MGIETLNTAAHAAGFAMATSDEVSSENKVIAELETESWRSGDAVLLNATPSESATAKAETTTDWLKGLLGVFGRGAPA